MDYIKYSPFWDLSSVDWQLVTGVSAQTIGPIFKGQTELQGSPSPLKIGPIACPETPVTTCPSTLRNISEERRPLYTAAEAFNHAWAN